MAATPGTFSRAGAQIPLLAAAEQNGLNLYAGIHIKEADSLGSMDLVAADAHKIDAQLLRINAEFPVGLHRVHVEEDFVILLFQKLPDFLDGPAPIRFRY